MTERATRFEFGTAAQKGASNRQGSSIADNFSLVIGGPFYGALQRMGLFKAGHNTQRIVASLALTWLPLAVLSILGGTAWGNKVKIPLLYDVSIYGRFFVALPLLILAEA